MLSGPNRRGIPEAGRNICGLQGQQTPKQKRMVIGEAAVERFRWCGALLLQPVQRQRRQRVRVALTADERLEHGSSRDTEDVGGDITQLDVRRLWNLLDAVGFLAVDVTRLTTSAGEFAQLPERG